MAKSLENEKLRLAIMRSAELLVEHGLGSWRIKVNAKRSTLAETCHSDKTITFSKYFIRVADKEKFDGITLHEITHAVLGPGYGHGPKFVAKCTELSKTDKYAGTSAAAPILKYLLSCPDCGFEGYSNSKAHYVCPDCFDEDKTVRMVSQPNKMEVVMW